jgi:hypothetical protein
MSEVNTEKQEGGTPESTEVNVDELNQKIAQLEQDKENLVGEVKSIRKEKQDLKAQLDEVPATTEAKPVTDTTNLDAASIAQVVEDTLAKRDASRAKSNQVAALEEFVADHKEFDEGNDPTGLKRDALEKAVARFNTNGLTEKKDFMAVIKDAHRLLGGTDTSNDDSSGQVINPYSSTPKTTTTPSITDNTQLTEREQAVIKQNGWTEERYLELKKSMPDFVDRIVNA